VRNAITRGARSRPGTMNTMLAAFWKSFGIPAPQPEFRFHPARNRRFDYAWPNKIVHVLDTEGREAVIITFDKGVRPGGVAVEVKGGIWTRGRHTRGAELKQEHEKLTAAAVLGWRILYCTPGEELTSQFARQIKTALEFKP